MLLLMTEIVHHDGERVVSVGVSFWVDQRQTVGRLDAHLWCIPLKLSV